jgi:hypothetical protein
MVRLGMMTVCRCQVLVAAGRGLNARVKRMAVIILSHAGSIGPLDGRAVQNVMVPPVGFRDGSFGGDGESDQ